MPGKTDKNTNRIELVRAQCRAIEEREPVVHAFVEGTCRCRQVLAGLEEAGPEAPLWGHTMGVKDIFNVDGFATGCGTSLPRELYQGPEAACVTALKKAGASVMGKTVTTEFAYLAPNQTSNPHNPAHTPGGSSQGSAAGVAAGFFDFALGTQTVGSTNRPAAYCGVVGFKPSYGLVSLEGVFPFSASADHVGVFCKTAAELNLYLPHMAGRAWRALKNPAPLAGLKLGIPGRAYNTQAEDHGLKHFYGLTTRLVELGCETRPTGILEDIEDINELHLDMIAAEVYRVHQPWLAEYSGLYRKETMDILKRGEKVPQERLEEGIEMRHILREKLEARMDALKLDAWICPPATGEAPQGLHTTGSGLMNLPWTMAGLPAITLPAGTGPRGLPLGLQVIGRFGKDEQLVAVARRLEKLLT